MEGVLKTIFDILTQSDKFLRPRGFRQTNRVTSSKYIRLCIAIYIGRHIKNKRKSQVQPVDALALGGDEGRDKLR